VRLSRRGALVGLAASSFAAPGLVGAQPAVREIVDAAGRRVRIPGNVTRVYAAGPPASILLFALAPDTLAGWTSAFRPNERPFVPERYADLPTLGRLTGRGNTANPETVLAARPDVIFDYGTVNDTYASLADRVQSQTGIPYLLIDGAFDKMGAAFELLGDILGRRAQGDAFARDARATVSDVASRVARVAPAGRPRVYYARGPRGLETGRPGSINVEALERAGAVNVVEELGPGGLAQVSIEQVLHWNPDTIVALDPNFVSGIGENPLWRGIDAVRRGRVFAPPGVPFGWIDFPPSVNRLLGLRWLGSALYPAQFSEPLGPIIADFFERYYHRRPDAQQIAPFVRAAGQTP